MLLWVFKQWASTQVRSVVLTPQITVAWKFAGCYSSLVQLKSSSAKLGSCYTRVLICHQLPGAADVLFPFLLSFQTPSPYNYLPANRYIPQLSPHSALFFFTATLWNTQKNTRQSIPTVGTLGSHKAGLVSFVIIFSARFKITSDWSNLEWALKFS